MRTRPWRLALTGAGIVILGAAGIGLVSGAGAPPSSTTQAIPASTPGANGTAPTRQKARERLQARPAMARLLRIGRHLVHVEATITDPDGQLVTIWLDHGTVQSVGNGSLTIAETGGATETIGTDAATKVRLGRGHGSLADLKVGVEVFVQSRVVDGGPLAKRILVIPARPG